ncbi:MAG: CPBP family intramembrane metalloprotease [Myxococcales bacterium]|nr:CPBP family intramembrane metalloprotease [Myxococcales bacterium]
MTIVWPPDRPALLGALVLAATLYVVFHYFGSAPAIAPRLDAARGADANAATAVHRQRIWGFALLGVAPLIYAALALPRPLAFYGLGLEHPLRAAMFVGGVVAVVLPFVFLASRKPTFRDHYPQIRRAAPWDAALRRDNAATWTLYLLGYEFFFRGFLLFAVADAWGVWAGVGATTLAYVYAHLPKNADETIGTIPMGVVFALGALWSGGIWAPWLAHVIIANTSDLLASRPRA